MARKRKTITMTVVVTVPDWCSATKARKTVREQINDPCFDYYIAGPDFKFGRVRAQSVSITRNT